MDPYGSYWLRLRWHVLRTASVAPDFSFFLCTKPWRYSTSCHFIRSFGAGLGWLKALEITVRRKGGIQISPGYGHGLLVVHPRNEGKRPGSYESVRRGGQVVRELEEVIPFIFDKSFAYGIREANELPIEPCF
jgi:hypothetical protein